MMGGNQMNYNNIGNGNSRKRRRTHRKGLGKEQIIMLTASLFVLTALTMTGVYVKEKNKDVNDEYVVDLSEIEKNVPDKVAEITDAKEQMNQQAVNDMDVDPAYEETNSDNVKNEVSDLTDAIQIPGVGTVTQSSHKNEEIKANQNTEPIDVEENTEEENGEEQSTQPATETSSNNVKSVSNSYQFSESDQLQWPIVGNVLINYSVDKTVYFPTLDKYKYNSAIVIQATVGEPITAAASGEVVSVFQDPQIGNGITVNIGNGYEVTYGQLDDIQVSTGENIDTGTLLGYVAEPTKYYCVEGSNVYFKVTKDEIPVNPMGQLE